MLNIQAAFGVSQMDEIEQFITIKEKNYNLYKELLYGTQGITLMPFNESVRPNYWFYSIYVDKSKYRLDRDALLKKLIENGVQSRPVWRLSNKQKPYLPALSVDIKKACDYEANVLNVPCSVNLAETQIKYVCDIIKNE
jgi:dTDP-4-amino-4,6-dideoxygalactose transaminase